MQTTALKEKVPWPQKKTQATHIGDTSGVLGSGDQGTLDCRALQNLIFIKQLLLRAGNELTFLTHRNRPKRLGKMSTQRHMS